MTNQQLKPIVNPTELDIHRSESVQRYPGFTFVFNGTTGQERTSFSHHGGASMTYTTRVASEFNPSDRQSLTHGNYHLTVRGDHFETSEGMEEKRVHGDFNIITGSPSFFNDTYASEYIQKRSEFAAALTAPELTVGGYGNNTGAQYEQKGELNPTTNSTQGGTFDLNPIRESLPDLAESLQKDLTRIEQNLGYGGNIKIESCKHLFLIAGTAPTTFDSAFINPIGRSVKKETLVDGDTFTVSYAPVGQVEPKATTLNMPFGDISLIGTNKVKMMAGAGGIDLSCGGSVNLIGTGVTIVGGSQTIIQGGVGVAIVSDSVEVTTSHLAINSPTTYVDGKLTVSKDIVIEGDLYIQGNVFVKGNLVVDGEIKCKKTIKADVDVIAGNISLKNHVHGSSPKPS